MKLVIVSQSPKIRRQLFSKNDLCLTPSRKTSVSKSKSKKSLQVTCKNKYNQIMKIQPETPTKYHKLMCQTPCEKKTDLNRIINHLTLTEHKTPVNRKKPNLLVKTDLLDFYSLTTIDSLQMKKSKVGYLWNCQSPVNKLTQFD